MRVPALTSSLTALILLLASGSATGGELYKWVDENGVVNYSNNPPPKTGTGKPPTVVEDRISVYTPEQSVSEALERERERRRQKPPAASFTLPPEPERRAPVATAPPPPPPYDPCLNPNDLNCPGVVYDSSPAFRGRRRQQPLVQPQLPPGTIAGQGAGPGAYIPGQSGTAQPLPAPPPRRSPGAGFTVNEREYERDRRHRR